MFMRYGPVLHHKHITILFSHYTSKLLSTQTEEASAFPRWKADHLTGLNDFSCLSFCARTLVELNTMSMRFECKFFVAPNH